MADRQQPTELILCDGMIVRYLLSAYRHVCVWADDGRPDAVAVTQRQRATNDDTHRNTNNSSASVVRRLFSQVDRLFEGCSEDRERALELLRVREQQVITISIYGVVSSYKNHL